MNSYQSLPSYCLELEVFLPSSVLFLLDCWLLSCCALLLMDCTAWTCWRRLVSSASQACTNIEVLTLSQPSTCSIASTPLVTIIWRHMKEPWIFWCTCNYLHCLCKRQMWAFSSCWILSITCRSSVESLVSGLVLPFRTINVLDMNPDAESTSIPSGTSTSRTPGTLKHAFLSITCLIQSS